MGTMNPKDRYLRRNPSLLPRSTIKSRTTKIESSYQWLALYCRPCYEGNQIDFAVSGRGIAPGRLAVRRGATTPPGDAWKPPGLRSRRIDGIFSPSELALGFFSSDLLRISCRVRCTNLARLHLNATQSWIPENEYWMKRVLCDSW